MIHLVQDANFRPTIYSDALAGRMSERGAPTDFVALGRAWNPARYQRTISKRFLQGAYAALQTRLFARTALKSMKPGDVAVVYESAPLTSHWLDAGFQRALVRRGVRYVPVFPDAWPLSAEWLRRCCERRVALASAVGCVTPGLVELFRTTFPGKRVLLLEEPVPTDRFAPVRETDGPPVVCWSGPPHKIDEVVRMLPVLESVARRAPFRLRVVSGLSRPELRTSLPVEWMPFDESDYQTRFAGADVAFARYRSSPYDACKGNYKIKTYLAAGCAVITSPVGYNRELILPCETGLFAKTRDEWEQAFLRLLENPAERIAMRKAARAEAEKRFSFKAIARQYAGVFRSLSLE